MPVHIAVKREGGGFSRSLKNVIDRARARGMMAKLRKRYTGRRSILIERLYSPCGGYVCVCVFARVERKTRTLINLFNPGPYLEPRLLSNFLKFRIVIASCACIPSARLFSRPFFTGFSSRELHARRCLVCVYIYVCIYMYSRDDGAGVAQNGFPQCIMVIHAE